MSATVRAGRPRVVTHSAYTIGVVVRVFTPVRKIWQALHAAICMMTVPDLDLQGLLWLQEKLRCNSETSQSASP